jgi:hypothetical protein
MIESQHKPRIEIDKAEEDLKLRKCGQGWLVMDDLDLGWINMHPMLIKNIVKVLDHVHAKGSFFQICI